MPLVKLPHRLIDQFRRRVSLIETAFHTLPILDRRGIREETPLAKFPRGERVRRFDASKRSRVPIAIKWSHGGTAEGTIGWVKRVVRNHNNRFPRAGYFLQEPHAYPAGKNLIIMAEVTCPTIEEVLQGTPHGKPFFEKLSERWGVTIEKLAADARILYERTGIDQSNALLAGVRKGKFVFVPLADIY